jgi:hypothetical protein
MGTHVDPVEVGRAAEPDIRESAEKLDETLQKTKKRYRGSARLDEQNLSGHANRANDFPVKIVKPHKRDTLIDLKTSVTDDNGASRFGHATLSDADLEWMDDKRKQAQKVDFDRYIANYYDLTNPAEAELLARYYPEYFSEREKEIESQADLQKQLALIRLRGPKSKKDFLLIYMIQNRTVPLPQGPLWNPAAWGNTDQDTPAGYKRGIFAPARYIPGYIQPHAQRYDALWTGANGALGTYTGLGNNNARNVYGGGVGNNAVPFATHVRL